MPLNGEFKALWGMSLIVVSYLIYMTCTPDPADGMLLSGIIASIVALVTGVATKAVITYRKAKEF